MPLVDSATHSNDLDCPYRPKIVVTGSVKVQYTVKYYTCTVVVWNQVGSAQFNHLIVGASGVGGGGGGDEVVGRGELRAGAEGLRVCLSATYANSCDLVLSVCDLHHVL